eukprot:TRINITY_DN4128_c0_g1_i3.p2 TRINITY_DN4128_c0_g1~~TRINITY_DN4128_c0_g1_i3.p2  ORF type:complete len:108 (-),score=22.44 TRINITY_DN4128_c0_g1_i3:72-395(-)
MSKHPGLKCGQNYPYIENHGVVGNMKTLALVCLDGSIDWFCYPHFDSPSVFCSLLDSNIGGSFRILPACDTKRPENVKQFYLPDTNLLVTRFYTEEGSVAEVVSRTP